MLEKARKNSALLKFIKRSNFPTITFSPSPLIFLPFVIDQRLQWVSSWSSVLETVHMSEMISYWWELRAQTMIVLTLKKLWMKLLSIYEDNALWIFLQIFVNAECDEQANRWYLLSLSIMIYFQTTYTDGRSECHVRLITLIHRSCRGKLTWLYRWTRCLGNLVY